MGDEDSTASVLFVHAHPDDETISTGGTLALLEKQGIRTEVVTCTRGERGEVIPPELRHLASDPEALGEFRSRELREALKVLGVSGHRFLGEAGARWSGLEPRRYRDSGMAWDGNRAIPDPAVTDPESFCSADLKEVVADLVAAIDEIQPQAIVSYDEQGGYGHPDHVRAAKASRVAAEVCGIPCFEIVSSGWEAATADRRMSIDSVFGLKIQALEKYRTQLKVEGDSIVHSGGQTEEVGKVESYREVLEQPGSAGDWARLGIWWKVAAAAILLLLGVLVGTIGTINHQVKIGTGEGAFPIGLVLALAVSGLLLAGLRLYFNYRPLVVAGAVGFLTPVILFSQESFAGSVLIPFNEIGVTWLVGAIVIAAVAVLFPRLRRKPGVTMKETALAGEESRAS